MTNSGLMRYVVLTLAALALGATAAAAGSKGNSGIVINNNRQLMLETEIQNSIRSRELYNAQQQLNRQQDRQNTAQPPPRPAVPVVRQPCQLGARGVAAGSC